MTPADLAKQLEPEVRTLLTNFAAAIKKEVGPVKWAAIVVNTGVMWKVITSQTYLPRFIQMGIEYGIAKSKPYVAPVLPFLNELRPWLESLITDEENKLKIHVLLDNVESLFNLGAAQMLEPVQLTLQGHVDESVFEAF